MKTLSDFIRQGLNSLLRGTEELTHAGQRNDQQIQGLREELAVLRAQLNQLTDVVRRVFEAPVTTQSAASTALERVLAGHQGRIDLLSRKLTERRDELVTKDYMVHQEIAKRFDALVQQSLVSAAVQNGAKGEYDIALVVAELSERLFGRQFEEPDVDAICVSLAKQGLEFKHSSINELLRAARDLQRLAQQSGHRHEWRLHAEPDAALDEQLQQPWTGCSAADAVDRVVAPAYLVEDEVYYRQLVYTRPKPAPKRRAPQTRKETAVLPAHHDQDDPAPTGPAAPPGPA